MERKIRFHDIEQERSISIRIKSILFEENKEENNLSNPNQNANANIDNHNPAAPPGATTSSISCKVSIPKIFEFFIRAWDDLPIDSLAFLCEGKFYQISRETMDVDPSKTRVIYLIHLNPRLYRQVGRLDFAMDEISFNAAIDWMNTLSSDELAHHHYTINLLSALHATVPTIPSIESPAAAALPAAENRNQGVLDPILNILQLLQWRLLIRMVVLYFIFFHHRGMKDEKKYAIIGLMAIAYLFQIGALAYVANKFRALLGINNNRQPGPGPAGAAGGNNGNNNNNNNNNNHPHHRFHDIAHILVEGVNIPRTAGFLYDVAAIFIGFFASLFPAWEVRAEPLPPPTDPPASAEPQANGNQENNQNDQNNQNDPNNNQPPPQQQPRLQENQI